MSRTLPLLLLALAACADAEAGAAKSTGAIRGVVSFEGTPPARAPLDRTSDPKCGGEALAEDVVVNDGKLRDVLVRVENGAAGIHEAPAEPVIVTQENCRYSPRVIGLVAGQKLEIRNGDPTFHNVRGNLGKKVAFNLPQGKAAKPIVRDNLGAAGDIVSLACDVHPWMAAYAGVVAHPFYAVTAADGAYALSGLPAGAYTVEASHPLLGAQRVEVALSQHEAASADFVFSD